MKLSDFLKVLHSAVNYASDSLLKKNQEIIESYFTKVSSSEGDCLSPKTIKMDYPIVGEDNVVIQKKIEVPLITLVPLTTSKLKKATFSFEFQIVEKDEDVSVFFNKGVFGNGSNCKMELTIVPDENPDGIKCILEKYNKVLENQE